MSTVLSKQKLEKQIKKITKMGREELIAYRQGLFKSLLSSGQKEQLLEIIEDKLSKSILSPFLVNSIDKGCLEE